MHTQEHNPSEYPRREYDRPPLVEALCAFQFVPGPPWDATVLGLVYDRIKESFSQKMALPQPLFNLTVGPAPTGAAPSAGMQFRRADNSALVQLSPDSLTVNHLTPYRGWPDFRAMIGDVLGAYRAVAAPQGLRGISLRYINRLSIPAARADAGAGDVQIRDYLLTHPTVPAGVPTVFSEWAQRIVVPGETARQTLVMQSGTVPGDESFPIVFMLDLEARPAEGQAVALADAMNWLEGAHANVGSVFESCLGPQARALFGERAGAGAG